MDVTNPAKNPKPPREWTPIEILRDALRVADSHGLRSEFRSAYLRYRARGSSVDRACWNALYDWDI